MTLFDENKRFLRGINAKDADAWEELYRRFYAPLCNYVWSLLGNIDEAKDIVQESLISVWHAEAVFNEVEQLAAFLYRTVYHNVLKYLRDKDVYQYHLQSWYDKKIEEEKEEHLYRLAEEELVGKVRMALGQLSPRQREIMELSIEGMTVEAIAQQLEISINTVKTLKKRAYQILKNYYQKGS